ncbi:hypothetical protein Lal_00019641 [Lupinus albus]|nr:hypothetical protein Lal_00019641 [Lupinus albus]
MNEPRVVAPLLGPGAGAGTSVATTALTEAAAKRTAHATFFISMSYISLKRKGLGSSEFYSGGGGKFVMNYFPDFVTILLFLENGYVCYYYVVDDPREMGGGFVEENFGLRKRCIDIEK